MDCKALPDDIITMMSTFFDGAVVVEMRMGTEQSFSFFFQTLPHCYNTYYYIFNINNKSLALYMINGIIPGGRNATSHC